MAEEFDAIVVGSGIAGGWAAKELTEAGLRTLVIEAGAATSLSQDWSGATPDPDRGHEQTVQRQCYACTGPFQKLFVSDHQHPYLSLGGDEFAWIRGRHLGGRSLAWARTCFRLGALDFEATAGNAAVDWPLDYAELAPWYRRVEHFAGLTGRRDGLPQVPDSECLASFEHNAAESLLSERLEQRFGGARRLISSRVATLSVPHRGRPAYAPRAHQTHPVQDAAHFSSLSATLPAALATGRLQIWTDSVVHRLTLDSRRRRVRSVEVIDAVTRAERSVRAPLVMLAASALESTRILLNSTSREFPDGLANSSGCLGRYLMDHLTGTGAVGRLPSLRGTAFTPGRPATTYIPRYRNLGRNDVDFVGGYAFICDAYRPSIDGTAVFREPSARDAGAGDWVVRLWGFGECLPERHNQVRLDAERRDAWGVPALQIDFRWGSNELAMAREMADSAAEMLEAIGATDVERLETPLAPGLAIHEMGTARMGRDPRTSVVNSFGQTHDIKNLFVVDGAVMPASPCQNPSLTYMALSSRAACHAAAELRKGNLTGADRSARHWVT